MAVLEFFTSAMAGGVIYDFMKYGGKASVGFLKDKIKNIVLTDEELNLLAEDLNKISEKVDVNSVEEFNDAIKDNSIIKELYSKYGKTVTTINQNVNGNYNVSIAGNNIINPTITVNAEKQLQKKS